MQSRKSLRMTAGKSFNMRRAKSFVNTGTFFSIVVYLDCGFEYRIGGRGNNYSAGM